MAIKYTVTLDDIENESSVDEKNQKVVKKKVIIKK